MKRTLQRALRTLPLIIAPMLVGACANSEAPEAASKADAPADDTAADEEIPQAARDVEGGTGSRAKGEEGQLGDEDKSSRRRYGVPSSADDADAEEPAESDSKKRPSALSPEKNKGFMPAPSPDTPTPSAPIVPRKQGQKEAKPGRTADGFDVRRRGGDGKLGGLLDEQGRPTNMFFRHYGVNPTVDTAEMQQSTFSIDVDTASYSMARSFLSRGVLPNEAAIRVEEMVNAFDYDYAAPTDDTFNVHAEAAPSPNRRGYHVLHVGVQGKEIAKAARKPAHLSFVIDVSGSMDQENRLGLVKRSLRLLVNELKEQDTVAVVTYGSNARVALPATSAHDKARILRTIDSLKIEGATNAEAGLRLGYQLAGRTFRPGHVNRVVLCSDGVANMGRTGPQSLVSHIIKEGKRGITLSTVGFGMGNYNDVLMEQLADKGEGNYHYVDKLGEARKVFVDDLTGTLQVIAKDVKIQVDFDPAVVKRYRLIGYENRALKTRDFDDDRVDAGEIGAGHSVTAIYEIRLADNSDKSKPLGKVRLRFKQPSGGKSALLEKSLRADVVRSSMASLSSPTKLSLAVAQFGEKLRGSYWARNVSYADILENIGTLDASLRQRENVIELARLVKKAKDLDSRGDKFEGKHGPIARMDFDRVPVLR